MREVAYVVIANDGRMVVNNSYGELTRSLIRAKKWTSIGAAQARANEQNAIVNSPTITTKLKGLTFEAKPVVLTVGEE